MSNPYEIRRIETFTNELGETALRLDINGGELNALQAALLAARIGMYLRELSVEDAQELRDVRAKALEQFATKTLQLKPVSTAQAEPVVHADPVGSSPSEAQQAAVAAAAAVAETTKKTRAKKVEAPPPEAPPINSAPPAQVVDFQQQVAAQAAPVAQPEVHQQVAAPAQQAAKPAQTPQQQTIDEARKMIHDAVEGGMDIESTRELIKGWAESVPTERRVGPGALLMWVESIYSKAGQGAAAPATTAAPATDLLASVTSPTTPPPQQTPPPNMTFAQQVAQTISAPPAGAADPNLVAAVTKILEDLSVNGPPTAARFASATRPLAVGGVSGAQIVGAISSNPALFAAYPQVSSPNALLSLPELLPILWGKV